MRAFWILIIIVAAAVGWFGDQSAGVGQAIIPDVSWPQCGLELSQAARGIVGINGGLALRPNPCLASEAANYRLVDVYLNTGYPGPAVAHSFQIRPKACQNNDKVCLAYNYGYNSGLYSFRYALMNGVIAKRWWLDVETENSWDNDVRVNRAALSGLLDSLKNLVGQEDLGFYSFPGQWDLLTGEWRNDYPVWVATGSKKILAAKSACRPPSFTDGPILLAQFTPELDQNLVCGQNL